ncbi:MAG TPA: diaminopimelate epimerase [Pyrinomonadaceae bacterium]|nr:diaminopimelate epimerase [Pyrinomonadaceae bacterium]
MIPFCKFHGFGNDYIVIEKTDVPPGTDLSELAKAICHRHTGAGSDGIAVIEKADTGEADFFCEIVNPDGSIAGFSGNGTRCAVSYIYYKGLWTEPNLRLKVRSGVKNFHLIEEASPGHYSFEAEIGKPDFTSAGLPVRTPEPKDSVVDLPVSADGRTFPMSCVNVGNPVAITFVDSFDFDWRHYGRVLETHDAFPEKANIVFVKVRDRENIDIRIWERAAGETSSSGTCSSGAAVLSAFTGRTGRQVSVHAVGGTTEFLWRDDDEMLITGRADLVYCGEWPDQPVVS